MDQEGVVEVTSTESNEVAVYKRNGKFKTINLKIRGDAKVEFLRITHERHTTMQDVLSAFVDSYVDNPDKFRIKMEVV